MTPKSLAIVAIGCLLSASAFAAQPAAAPAPAATFVPPPPDVVPVCTRATLQSAVDSYVAAQKSGDAKKMAFAEKAKYLENMSDVEPALALWNTALPVAYDMSILDSKRCKTFTEIIVTEGGHQYVIGTRLYVNDGRITRIDSLVTDKGDWLFNANNYLKVAKTEDWTVLPPEQRTPMQDMLNGANAYLDLFADKHVRGALGRAVRADGRGRLHQSQGRQAFQLQGGHPERRALHCQPRLHRG